MNYYDWKKVKKEITLKSILGESYVQFAPKSINLDFDVESLKDPKKFSKMEISIKQIDSRIRKKGYPGELFVESGENLIALCLLYLRHIHTMNDFTFVEDVLIGSDGYVCAKNLPKEQEDMYKDWAYSLEKKIDSLIDDGLLGDVEELCEKYKNMKVTAEVYEVTYVGPTKAIKYSEDMSIGEFSDMIKEQFGIIPVFLHKGEYKKFPASTRLGEIGVTGEKTLDVKLKEDVSSLGRDIQEQNELEASVNFKYLKRPWAFIEDSTFDNVDVLPGLFRSIGWTLLIRFTYKYIDKL